MAILHGTHHTAIICSNYERSKHFYSKILGLKILHEAYREDRKSYKLDLKLADGTQIELFSFPTPPPRPSYPEACGLRHLAFKVEDIELALREVTAQGVKAESIRVDEFTGKRFAFISDPDGLPIEFYETNEKLTSSTTSWNDLTIGMFVSEIGPFSRAWSNKKPWDLTACLVDVVSELILRENSATLDSNVFIHPNARVESGVTIKGPAYISAGCFVASGAYLRGGVYLGEDVKIGPGCEIKSSALFSKSCVAHFNFIGDSILGCRVNFEAGAHTANHWNERADKSIQVLTSDGVRPTDSNKFGSIVGDDSRVGANSVLSPGTILPKSSVVPRLALVEQQTSK